MSEDAGFGLNRIGQIAVNAHDLARATAFYKDRLGMEHLFSVPNLSFFDCGGVRLMLDKAENPEFDHPSSVLYFTVDDIQKATATLKSRGVAFEAEPHRIAQLEKVDVWMSFFRDSENNMLALMSEVARR
jgi:predicted enzyme related to lactoylglutathione lyase